MSADVVYGNHAAGSVGCQIPARNRPGHRARPEMTALPVGRAQMRREGRSGLAILAFGVLVDPAQKIAERLDATVVNMRFVKPLDEDLIISVAARHRAIITIEENATLGGAGSAVAELLASEGLQVPLLQIGIPDRFIEHGSRDSCLAAAGLDPRGPHGQRGALVGHAGTGSHAVCRGRLAWPRAPGLAGGAAWPFVVESRRIQLR